MEYIIKQADFFSNNTLCDGEFFLPKGEKNPPVVVMAHGFCAEKAFSLYDFAKCFAQRGIAVFVFDYRGFGKSRGKIRNYVSPSRHLSDWQAAIEHVRKSGMVNPHKLALWGSSFSGGHVIKLAANDHSIRAIVSQVPFVDGFSTLGIYGPGFLIKTTPQIIHDLWNVARRKAPHYIPATGKPGSVAALNQPGNLEDYLALVPEGSKWENKVPARALLSALRYRPGLEAKKLRCPALFVIAENDNLILASAVEKTARRAPQGRVLSLPVGHFDVYQGNVFKKMSAAEADFFEEFLL